MEPITDLIPLELYKKIVDKIPIVGVDIIVEYQGGALLVKRTEEPNKDWWWFPGGRVFKYESPEKAALRIVKREVGLDSTVKKLVGVYTTNFERWSGIDHFSIHVVYHVKAEGEVKLDDTSSEFKVIKSMEEVQYPYMKKALEDSGIFT